MSQAAWRNRFQLTENFLRQYELLAPIGKGAMGEVVKARQIAVGRSVAIKFLRPQFYQDKEGIRRFRSEAAIMARLNHPNIVHVITFDDQAKVPYIVLEYVKGMSLRKLIQEKGPLPVWSALKVLNQICLGLQQAHEAKIIHRDLKSENILIAVGGVAKIVDFGLAKLTEGRGDQTSSGVILGTPEYMSPEQVRGDTLDGRTDLYSAGVILFEMLTGSVPFRNPAVSRILLDHLETPPPLLHTICPNLPPELNELVGRALAKDCISRYRSAEAFLLAIQGTGRSLQRQELLSSRAEIPIQAGQTQKIESPPKSPPAKPFRTQRTRPQSVAEAPPTHPQHTPTWNPLFTLIALTLFLGAATLTYRATIGARRDESEVRAEALVAQKMKDISTKLEAFMDEGIGNPAQGVFLTRAIARSLDDPSCRAKAQKALKEIMENTSAPEILLAAGLPLAKLGVSQTFSPLLKLFPSRQGKTREKLLAALKTGARVIRGPGRFAGDEDLSREVCQTMAEILQEPFRGRYPPPERCSLIALYSSFASQRDLQETMLDFSLQTRFGKPVLAPPEVFAALGRLCREPRFKILKARLERRYFHKKNPKYVALPEDQLKALQSAMAG
jgi:serine/threonine protein kinase